MKYKIGDHVKVLSGAGIANYTGGWTGTMEPFVGKTGRIIKCLTTRGVQIVFDDPEVQVHNSVNFLFDSRAIEPVMDAEGIVERIVDALLGDFKDYVKSLTEDGRPAPKFLPGEQVRILDGSGIRRYVGGWIPAMNDYIGGISTVDIALPLPDSDRWAYRLKGIDYTFDERGLEEVIM